MKGTLARKTTSVSKESSKRNNIEHNLFNGKSHKTNLFFFLSIFFLSNEFQKENFDSACLIDGWHKFIDT